LHIRSNKFGKLSNGTLVSVEHNLIKQHSKHIVDLTFGVKIILAMNGKIWLEPNQLTENSLDQIARLKNIIQTLGQHFICIRVENLIDLYNQTSSVPVQAMGSTQTREMILSLAAQTINTQNIQNVAELIRGVEDKPSTMQDEGDYYE